MQSSVQQEQEKEEKQEGRIKGEREEHKIDQQESKEETILESTLQKEENACELGIEIIAYPSLRLNEQENEQEILQYSNPHTSTDESAPALQTQQKKEQGKLIEEKEGDIIEKERGGIIEKERGGMIEKERGGMIEKERGGMIEKEREGTIEKERGGIIEKEREGIIEKERGDIIEKEIEGMIEEDEFEEDNEKNHLEKRERRRFVMRGSSSLDESSGDASLDSSKTSHIKLKSSSHTRSHTISPEFFKKHSPSYNTSTSELPSSSPDLSHPTNTKETENETETEKASPSKTENGSNKSECAQLSTPNSKGRTPPVTSSPLSLRLKEFGFKGNSELMSDSSSAMLSVRSIRVASVKAPDVMGMRDRRRSNFGTSDKMEHFKSVYSNKLEQISSETNKLERYVTELINTEKDYLSDLNIILDVKKKPFSNFSNIFTITLDFFFLKSCFVILS